MLIYLGSLKTIEAYNCIKPINNRILLGINYSSVDLYPIFFLFRNPFIHPGNVASEAFAKVDSSSPSPVITNEKYWKTGPQHSSTRWMLRILVICGDSHNKDC
jgi:hypothetical protein